MASLLNLFPSSPPPVIRRRAKELLDVIRNVLEILSSSAEPEVPQMPQEVVQTAALVEMTTIKESSGTVGQDIWAAGMLSIPLS